MSNTGPFVKKANPDLLPEKKDSSLTAPESANAETADRKASRGRYPEVQSAIRFPIKLPISVKSKTGESHTESQNISANGVLFQMVDSEMPVGSMVDFTISLPADVVGAEADVRLDCRGRVVRSFEDSGRRGVGVVIDEYRFDRAEQRGD
jgi:PilZ domain